VLAVTWLYSFVLIIAHASYLSIRWGYFGFTYSPPSLIGLIYMVALVSVAAAFVPKRLNRPSAVALWLLYTVIVVPTCVITSNLHPDALSEYGFALACLVAGFSAACGLARRGGEHHAENDRTARPVKDLPPRSFDHALLAAWVVSCILIFISYGSVMNFASFADIYTQRLTFTETTGGISSYVISHFSAVFSPALFALGLFRKQLWLSAIGLIGFVIVYAAVASKTAAAMPVFLLVMFFIISAVDGRFQSAGFLTGALCALVVGLMAMTGVGIPGAEAAYDLVLFRTIAIPALTFSQYFEYFGTFGHTFWSNIRGFDLILTPPAALESNPTWPDLGGLIGEFYYGTHQIQANANLFASEGVAAAGAWGALIIGLVLGGWLRLVDWLSRAWDHRFVIVVLFPIFNSLTNGALSTTQTSFGGALWLLIFLLYQPRKTAGPTFGQQNRHAPTQWASKMGTVHRRNFL
jgi:hypothetical protein